MDPTNFISAKLIIVVAILLMLFLYWAFNFIVLYHLTRFGIGTEPKKFAAVFLLGSIILFSVSVLLFSGLDLTSLQSQLNKIVTNSAFNITQPR